MLEEFCTQEEFVNDADLIDPNKSMRMPICLCIDVSNVMCGHTIQLRESIKTLINDILNDEFLNNCVELGVYTFSSDIKKVRDIVTLKNTDSANLDIYLDESCDNPDLAACIGQCIEAIERRKKDYNVKRVNYYQPHIIVLGASKPIKDDNWKYIIERVRNKQRKRRLSVIPIAIGGIDLGAYKELLEEGYVYQIDIGSLKEILKTVKNSMRKLSESSAAIYHKLNSMVSDWDKYLNVKS